MKFIWILAALATPVRDLPQDAGGLWVAPNALYIGAGASLAASARAADDTPQEDLSGIHDITGVTDVYGAGSFSIPVALGLWGAGRATNRPALASFGQGLTRTLGLTQLIVGPLKLISQRRRPDGSNHHSFPSGHTANTFAIARYIHRQTSTMTAVPFYTMAALTGAGRIEGRKHYLSDVVMGATLGLIAGSTIDRDGSGVRDGDRDDRRLSWQPMTGATGLHLRLQLD